MREVVFLNRNADKWKQFETLLADRRGVDPDRLAELYVQVVDDLSFAKTYYPGSRSITYLNSLAARVHAQIYKNKKEGAGRIVRFWRYELPLLMYQHRKELLYSFLLTLLAVTVGALSALNDDTYIRLILGDGYVNQTLENIKKGDPLGIYKSDSGISMFLYIPLHNILVSFRTFAFGLLFSVGTAYYLITNGIMLGAFHALFYQHNLLGTSLMVVWIHGTLEITSIVVAGCAGLAMGNGILFPGTYSRLQSFRRGAYDGMKIVFGTVPILLVAGFLESFVTRHTEMPLALNLAIIGISLAFCIYYLVIYPSHLHRRSLDGDRKAADS